MFDYVSCFFKVLTKTFDFWTKLKSFFFRQRKNFFNIQRIDLKSLLATQLGSSNIWQKFQDDWLARFFKKLCTNLKNLRKIDLSRKNKTWNVVKSVKKCRKSFLEAREMVFTVNSIFETCSEFDGKNFCKNRFLKKSFLKVLICPNFVIFCPILEFQNWAKNHKIWTYEDF